MDTDRVGVGGGLGSGGRLCASLCVYLCFRILQLVISAGGTPGGWSSRVRLAITYVNATVVLVPFVKLATVHHRHRHCRCAWGQTAGYHCAWGWHCLGQGVADGPSSSDCWRAGNSRAAVTDGPHSGSKADGLSPGADGRRRSRCHGHHSWGGAGCRGGGHEGQFDSRALSRDDGDCGYTGQRHSWLPCEKNNTVHSLCTVNTAR